MEVNVINFLSYTMLAFAIFVCIFQLFVFNAPYGRFSSTIKSKGLGPMISSNLGWFLMESPAFYISLITFLSFSSIIQDSEAYSSKNFVRLILLCLFLWHYLWRGFIYPALLRGNPMPISMCFSAFFFCTYNGFMQGAWLSGCTHFTSSSFYNFLNSSLSPMDVSLTCSSTDNGYDVDWLHQWNFIAGVVIFFFGWSVNQHSDYILRNLRKPGEKGYKIPYGGMFYFCSAANYTGEIIEWWGYALACWSLPAFAFAFFTTAMIGSRGIGYHKWYLEKFRDEYPKNRTAIIPFLI